MSDPPSEPDPPSLLVQSENALDEPSSLLVQPEPLSLLGQIENALEMLWKTTAELNNHWLSRRQCDYLNPLRDAAERRFGEGRLDNPALMQFMTAAGAILMYDARAAHEAEALAEANAEAAMRQADALAVAAVTASVRQAEALAKQVAEIEAKAAKERRSRASLLGKQRRGKTPTLDPIIDGMRKLGLTAVEIRGRDLKELMELLAALGVINFTDDNQATMLQRVKRARQEYIKRRLAEADHKNSGPVI
jgi:hypothetical protein